MVDNSPYTPGTIVLTVGTKRGLLLISSPERQHWRVEATKLESQPSRIYHALLDTRNHHRLFAADNGDFFGSFLRYSDDFGQTWQDPRRGIQFSSDSGQKLNDIWYIEPGRATDPQTLYVGADPASLWESHDSGETWEINEALLDLLAHSNWSRGAGGTCLHSIIADPTDPQRMWLGISGAGVLRTVDGGKSWQVINTLNDGIGRVGVGSHRLLQHPDQPDILYQQSRHGMYKSLDGGDSWIDITSNLSSSFGFPLALDVHHPGILYTTVVDPVHRYNIGEQFTIYRSDNAGASWQELTRGLPKGSHIRLKVLRHAMCSDTFDPSGIYVGTTSGQLFASYDQGEYWQCIANYLPPIFSVSATVCQASPP
jgi:photosystem II stability/assembly factor-like uncharacterized protein